MRKLTVFIYSFIIVAALGLSACGGNNETASQSEAESVVTPKAENSDPMDNKGIGPVKSVSLDPEVDQAMAAEGKTLYQQYCTACHKATQRYIGPSPAGILDRRSPEWIMNMILNPEGMTAEDPIAKGLLAEFLSPMANQNLTEDQARKILEYFRTL